MQDLPTAAAIRAALNQPLDPRLHDILADVLASAEANGLQDITHLVVIRPDDTEEAIKEAIGWSPLVNPIDEVRFGTAGFVPYWAWLQDLGGWYELIHTIGNDGFAYVLIIEDAASSTTELLSMSRHYAAWEGRGCVS